MLPLIVIGATDRVREILTPYAEVGHIQYHGTAEEAHHALDDEVSAQLRAGGTTLLALDERWRVHVAYGPKAYGALCAATIGRTVSPTLLHNGHTLILGLHIHEPKLTIRAIDGEPSEAPDNTMIWQAAVNARADLVLDLEQEDSVAHLVKYLDWKTP